MKENLKELELQKNNILKKLDTLQARQDEFEQFLSLEEQKKYYKKINEDSEDFAKQKNMKSEKRG